MKNNLVIVLFDILVILYGYTNINAEPNTTNSNEDLYTDYEQFNDYETTEIYSLYQPSDYLGKLNAENLDTADDESKQKENIHSKNIPIHNEENNFVNNHHNPPSHMDNPPNGPLTSDLNNMKLDRIRWEYNCENCWENINNLLWNAHSRLAIANWNYEVNITAETAEIFLNETLNHLNLTRHIMHELLHRCRPGNWKQRRMEQILLSTYGYAALDDTSIKKITLLQSDLLWMSARQRNCTAKHQATVTVCNDTDYNFDPSNEANELKKQYDRWRMATNHREPLKVFTAYIKEIHKAAKLNNISEPAQLFLNQYESKSLWQDLVYLVQKVKPLYNELHCFVRRRLRYLYSELLIKREGMIPVYFIDTPWNENWIHLLPMLQSQKTSSTRNFSAVLEKKKINVLKMVKIAEASLVQMGFDKMPPEFWSNSIFQLPPNKNNKNFVCNPEAWNMNNGDDYRIKICADLIQEDFIEIHRLLAGVQYSMQHKNLSFLFQRPPCEGLIEAVETAIELSASSIPYQESVLGLSGANETLQLLEVALRKIPFLFHAMATDQWRWQILNKKLMPKFYNRHWWNLRNEYEGVKRSDFTPTANLDAAMKYRDVVMEPYIGHIVGTIVGFQLYRHFCITSKQYDPSKPAKAPLHRCNIFTDKNVATMLKKGMALGASKPWYLILEEMIQEQDVNVTGIIEYFQPLQSWLSLINCKHHEYHSWKIFSNVPKHAHHFTVRHHTPLFLTTTTKRVDSIEEEY